MDRLYTPENITALAQSCIQLGKGERPELHWLKTKYQKILNEHHFKTKSAADRFLYEQMYGFPPEKDSEVLKIRYWRTGKYTPVNREQCLLFGKALGLSEAETEYLIQGYYDRSLVAYDSVPSQPDVCYQERRKYLQELIEQYLSNVPAERMQALHIPAEERHHFLRHLYFTDAFHYVDPSLKADPVVLSKHITSYRYDSELSRQMRLSGEIPRRTFIRHLLILGMPDLTLEKLNHQLQFFGYLPLDEEHTMIQGERLDWLLIQIFRQYEHLSETEDRHTCLLWFQEVCRTLDAYFMKKNLPRLRFMYFKALNL